MTALLPSGLVKLFSKELIWPQPSTNLLLLTVHWSTSKWCTMGRSHCYQSILHTIIPIPSVIRESLRKVDWFNPKIEGTSLTRWKCRPAEGCTRGKLSHGTRIQHTGTLKENLSLQLRLRMRKQKGLGLWLSARNNSSGFSFFRELWKSKESPAKTVREGVLIVSDFWGDEWTVSRDAWNRACERS